MNAIRTTPGRLAEVALALTERDRQVLVTLGALRLACTGQLQRLFFYGGRERANWRAAQRLLHKLVTLGLVARLERRVGGVRAGSAGYVYALAPAGQRLVTGAGPAGGRQPRRPWTPSWPFVRHRLAITELYVRLMEAERRGALELVSFVAEPRCWRSYLGAHGVATWVKPDAAVTTAGGDYEDRWFVEVDLGTESPQVLGRKCASYLSYQASGREQAAHGVFPLVLFVVPDARRRSVVQQVIARQAPAARPVFRASTEAEAVAMLAGGDR